MNGIHPANVTQERYYESLRRLEEAGEWPPDGLQMHVLFGSDGDLKVSEIWDSEQQLQAFGERLMPILSDVGIEFSEFGLLAVGEEALDEGSDVVHCTDVLNVDAEPTVQRDGDKGHLVRVRKVEADHTGP